MSNKRTAYSTKFKTNLVLEVLKGEKTLNEIDKSNKKIYIFATLSLSSKFLI
jgi:hypothetical protein